MATDARVLETTAWREFLDLRSTWERLARADPDAVLLGHDWAAATWKSADEVRRGEQPRILALGEAGACNALLPLRHNHRTRRLCFLNEGPGQRMDLVAQGSGQPWLSLLRHLRHQRDWRRLDLQYLRAPGAEAAMTAAAALGMAAQVRGCVRQRCIPLEGGWGELEARFSSYLRTNFRRRHKRLQAQAEVTLSLHSKTAGLGQQLEECMALERKGWKGVGGTAVLDRPALARFYRQLAYRMAAVGQLRLYGLRLGERLIAFEFCLADPRSRRLYSLKIAYDEEFRTASPGTVLRWLMLQRARDEFAVYEFLGDDAPWKVEWTPITAELRHVRIFNRTPGGLAWAARGRLAALAAHWPKLKR